jgi:hypothetical protein
MELRMIPAGQVLPGDLLWIKYPGKWVVVGDTLGARASSWAVGQRPEYIQRIMAEGNCIEKNPGETVLVGHTREALAHFRAMAVAYQATLTKAGKPSSQRRLRA